MLIESDIENLTLDDWLGKYQLIQRLKATYHSHSLVRDVSRILTSHNRDLEDLAGQREVQEAVLAKENEAAKRPIELVTDEDEKRWNEMQLLLDNKLFQPIQDRQACLNLGLEYQDDLYLPLMLPTMRFKHGSQSPWTPCRGLAIQ